jgi:NhaP-type Na+/H+ or K+/H+ antiporter
VRTSEVLLGAGLILVLAVASQVLASRIKIPLIIVLLPVGFIAGVLTRDVDPVRLLGSAFPPLVSLAVAVILYDASLNLNLGRMSGHTRRIVFRLAAVGIPVTLTIGAVVAATALGMSAGAAIMTGAILVVSGATAVGPLLAFVRPAERLGDVLSWEGSLLDPAGGILCVVVFSAIVATDSRGVVAEVIHFVLSVGIGLAGGTLGTVLLWVALRTLGLTRGLSSSAQLAIVIGVAAGCNALYANSGLLAAIVMGLALANLPGFDLPGRRPFLDTLIQLIVCVLILSLAARVTPQSLGRVIVPTLALAAILILVARPLMTFLATRATDLTRRERVFTGWMAPRGIVAAATAATFAGPLAARGTPGAGKIWPVVFLVIAITVVLYGLTTVLAARRLRVLRSPRSRPLLVGGDDWVIDLGRSLQQAGVDVLMLAGLEQQRERIRDAALELAPGGLLASVTADRADLKGITAVLLLTAEDDFNALAAAVLRDAAGDRVFRLGPSPGGRGLVAPFTGGDVLFGEELNRSAMLSKYEDGARITARSASRGLPAGDELLFLVHAGGQLDPATRQRRPELRDGDTMVLLSSTNS